jgi:hypothetical protein
MLLYERAIEEIRPYLGAQSEQFLQRQCEGHLRINPRDLAPKHLMRLSYWVMISASLIIPQDKAQEMEKKILDLGKEMTPVD